MRRIDSNPSRFLALLGILEGEGLFLQVSLIVGDHVPGECVLLRLKLTISRTCLQLQVTQTNGHDHMTDFTCITFTMRVSH